MHTWFPASSAGKESACNVGGPGSIPELGRSPGEGIGYPFQYSWASLVAETIKNSPAMWETWVWSLGWDDPLDRGMATHSNILAWRIDMDRGAWRATGHRSQRVRDAWETKHTHPCGETRLYGNTSKHLQWFSLNGRSMNLQILFQFLPSVEFLQQTRLNFRKSKTSSFRKPSTQKTSASNTH